MQVLCKLSDTVSDVRCKICGQGFLVFWSRTSPQEQEATRQHVIEALAQQHAAGPGRDIHPRTGFNLPSWSGLAKFSAAALLGGAHNLPV